MATNDDANDNSQQFQEENVAIPAKAAEHAKKVQKRPRPSLVWEEFETNNNENGVLMGTCKHCYKSYKADSYYGTSNFKRHLKHCPVLKKKSTRPGVEIDQE
ncbi:putative Zinc finger, BED-type, partial [Corchorus capsularis]